MTQLVAAQIRSVDEEAYPALTSLKTLITTVPVRLPVKEH
jgi:hypothetical protein